MNATIGIIEKRINSTRALFTGTSHAVVLKDPVNRENPVLLVTGAPNAKSNYMSWNGWYYWVDNIESETNNMYRVYAHVDPLATWKSDIKDTGAFVKFCSTPQTSAGNIDDPRLAPGHCKGITHTLITPDFLDLENGCVVVSAFSWESTTAGGHREYAMTTQSFYEMLKDFNSQLGSAFDSSMSIDELFCNSVLKFGGQNWKDNIQGAIYVPIPYSKMPGTAQSTIYIGGFHSNINCKVLNRTEIIHPAPLGKIMSMPASYFSGSLKEVMNCARFTVGELYHPCGVTSIKPSMFEYSEDECAAYVYFTMIANTGEYTISLESSDETFAIASGCLAYDMMNYVVTGSTAAGFAANFVVDNGIKVSSALAGICSGMNTQAIGNITAKSKKEYKSIKAGIEQQNDQISTVQQIGSGINRVAGGGGYSPTSLSAGGMAGLSSLGIHGTTLDDAFRVVITTAVPEIFWDNKYDDYCVEYGYPCESYLDSLPNGFVQCSGASCKADAPPAELATINSYLNSGIYIE